MRLPCGRDRFEDYIEILNLLGTDISPEVIDSLPLASGKNFRPPLYLEAVKFIAALEKLTMRPWRKFDNIEKISSQPAGQINWTKYINSEYKVENMIKGYYLMTEKVLKEKEKHKIGDDSLLGIWYEDTIHQLGNEISVKQFPSASQLEPIESAKQRILKVSDSFQAYVAKSEDIISPSFLGISRWSIIYISTWPSSIQSLKGILSAGPFKATKYLLRKIFKRFS